jgi:hypothetical protein
VATFLALLKLLPMVLEIIKMFQMARLTQQAQDEVITDLQMTADYLVARSSEAKAKVENTDDAFASDPNNRDNA